MLVHILTFIIILIDFKVIYSFAAYFLEVNSIGHVHNVETDLHSLKCLKSLGST